jgi:hypothetical protein
MCRAASVPPGFGGRRYGDGQAAACSIRRTAPGVRVSAILLPPLPSASIVPELTPAIEPAAMPDRTPLLFNSLREIPRFPAQFIGLCDQVIPQKAESR